MSTIITPTNSGADTDEFSQAINTDAFGPKTKQMFDFLSGRVIGQDRALQHVSRGFAISNANLTDGRRPIAVLLLTGPTGVGKTLTAEEVARFIIGDDLRPPLTRIQCARFQEHHRISELIGSPPGYVRSDESGLLSQLKIDEQDFWRKARPFLEEQYKGAPTKKKMAELMPQLYQRFGPFRSVILFDEIEKAHRDVHNMLLHIVDEGELGMNDGTVTHFNNSIIILTSNVGGSQQQDIIDGRGQPMGFRSAQQVINTDQRIYLETLKLVEKFFPPEFVGRLRRSIIVFRTLDRPACAKILENMLRHVQNRVLRHAENSIPVVLHFSPKFKESILNRGEVRKYGARPLRDLVEKEVTLRLANAIEAGEIRECDEVQFTVDSQDEVVLFRKTRPKAIRCRALTPLTDTDGTAIVPIVQLSDDCDDQT
ncbi:AAA family ATPase [Patescibacteria group bacterium]|nr:AAA family ATPase [Patescibacteria group bacterium]MBU1029140.1 AAA family ATPase [Patescibacteria group bacterium]MBU1916130.1 AAA family ATPase [Patescibacteria group bacterium]